MAAADTISNKAGGGVPEPPSWVGVLYLGSVLIPAALLIALYRPGGLVLAAILVSVVVGVVVGVWLSRQTKAYSDCIRRAAAEGTDRAGMRAANWARSENAGHRQVLAILSDQQLLLVPKRAGHIQRVQLDAVSDLERKGRFVWFTVAGERLRTEHESGKELAVGGQLLHRLVLRSIAG